MSTTEIIIDTSIVVGALVLGIVIERLFLNPLVRKYQKKGYLFLPMLIGSLNIVLTVWCTLSALLYVVQDIPFLPKWEIFVQRVLGVIFILSLTVVISRLTVAFVRYASRHKTSDGTVATTSIFINIARLAVFSVGVLLMFRSVGISVTPILGALGVGGLAVALALQDTLTNLFAGMQITAMRQISLGDYVKLTSSEEGFITDIAWRVTTLKTLNNNLVIIPNSKFSTSIITTYALPEKTLRIVIPIGVAYDSDLEKVEKVTMDIAVNVLSHSEGGLLDPPPTFRFTEFGSYTINGQLICYISGYVDQFTVRHEMIKQIKQRYAAEGIVIPSPAGWLSEVMNIKKGNETPQAPLKKLED